MNPFAALFLAIFYGMGAVMLTVAWQEFATTLGKARRFRTDAPWLLWASTGLILHAYVAWALLAAH